jgi:CHAT domain-containing protein
VSGEQDASLTVTSPGGSLLVTLEERGIAVSARFVEGSVSGASPVDRLGAIVLVTDTAPGETRTVRIHSEDSREIVGRVCASAELLASSPHRAQAERAFAKAGEAVAVKDWDAALAAYLESARDFDHLGLAQRAARARQAMAELEYRRFDRKRDAYALAGEALSEYGRDAAPAIVGALAGLQAKALLDGPHDEDDLRSVESEMRKKLAAARKAESASPYGQRELPRLDLVKSLMEFELNAPDKARALLTSSAQQCAALRDWECYATASQNSGLMSEETNNYSAAFAVYAEALRSLDIERYPRLVADIQDNLGRLQGKTGQFSTSERTHESAMKGYASIGDCAGVRRTLGRMGTLLVQMGELGDAESDLERAASVDCADLVSDAEAAAAVLPDSTRLSSGLSSGLSPGLSPNESARNSFATRSSRDGLCSRPIDARPLGTDNKIVVFNSLLALHDALKLEGETALAARCLAASRPYAASARTQMGFEMARGAGLLDSGKASEARAAFLQSLRIADEAKVPAGSDRRGIARLGLVKSELLAKSDKALSDAYEALHSSAARGDIDQTITALRLIASANASRPQESARTLRVAESLMEAVPIDELDGEQRATFLATQHVVFAQLTDLFAREASDPVMSWQAFETSERGRARSLRFAISQQTRDASATEAPPSERYRQLIHDVGQVAGETSRPEALVTALGDMATRRNGRVELLDRSTLEQTLGRLDATLVEYAVGPDDMLAFVVNADRIAVVNLGDRNQISDAAASLRERLRDTETSPQILRQAAQKLARLVLWPLREQLSAKRVIFVPDDALHTVPFAVLPWSADTNSELVVQRIEAAIAPSALFLTHPPPTGEAARGNQRFELIGDPVFKVSDSRRECVEGRPAAASAPVRVERALSDWTEMLPRLPGTRTEVSMVASLAKQAQPSSRIETLLGCAAIPSGLRAAADGADLLHIATHARVDAQRPRLSALALTPEPGAAAAPSAFGLLDILGLKLRSRLVVLSACETSRGKLLPGEGVLGPAQAFLQAGAATVLASYWRIDDQTTAAFMQKFYRNLLLEHMTAATALRRAQLETARTASPHVWAAFALYGLPDSSF